VVVVAMAPVCGCGNVNCKGWPTELTSIQVHHLPPGISKRNNIEHRLFSFISMNWRARPLISHRVIVEFVPKAAKGGLVQTFLEVQHPQRQPSVVGTRSVTSYVVESQRNWSVLGAESVPQGQCTAVLELELSYGSPHPRQSPLTRLVSAGLRSSQPAKPLSVALAAKITHRCILHAPTDPIRSRWRA
jgi:hypothetical protein